jgi:hypothetical protein
MPNSNGGPPPGAVPIDPKLWKGLGIPGAPAPAAPPSAYQRFKQYGQEAESGYETYVADPSTDLLAQTLHATPGASRLLQSLHRHYEATPSLAGLTEPPPEPDPGKLRQTVAEAVVPQTIPALAGTAMQMALGPETKFLPRYGLPALAQAGAALATGQGLGGSAEEGGKSLVSTATGDIVSLPFRGLAHLVNAGEPKLNALRGQRLLKIFKDSVPEIFKDERMVDGNDARRLFVDGVAVNKGNLHLRRVNDAIAQKVGNTKFNLELPSTFPSGHPVLKPGPNIGSFRQVNDWLKDIGDPAWNQAGDPRGAIKSQFFQQLHAKLRDKFGEQLDNEVPNLGRTYLRAHKVADAAHVAQDLIRGKRTERAFDRTINQGQLVPHEILSRVDAHSPALQRVFGEKAPDLMRYALGERDGVRPVPQKPAKWKWEPELGLNPARWIRYRRTAGERGVQPGFHPGDIFRDYMAPLITYGVRNWWDAHGDKVKVNAVHGTATKDLDSRRGDQYHEKNTALAMADDLRKNRAPVDVTNDLNSQRLSHHDVKQLLTDARSSDPATQVQGLPLKDVIAAAEVGTADEKRYLVPLIQRRMQQELPQITSKTMQANLAQRFKDLQETSVV